MEGTGSEVRCCRSRSDSVRRPTSGKTWTIRQQPKLLANMTVPVESAKLVLNLLAEGSSIHAAERVTGINSNTILKLLVFFGGRLQALP